MRFLFTLLARTRIGLHRNAEGLGVGDWYHWGVGVEGPVPPWMVWSKWSEEDVTCRIPSLPCASVRLPREIVKPRGQKGKATMLERCFC